MRSGALAFLLVAFACDSVLIVGEGADGARGSGGAFAAGSSGAASGAASGGDAAGGRPGGASSSGAAGTGGAAEAGSGGESGEALCPGALRASALSAGEYHACAVTLEGDILCWGSGQSGELGHGDATDSPVPVRVVSDETFAEVVSLTNSTCALSVDAELYCWGNNFDGVLADGSSQSAAIPVLVLEDVKAFSGSVANVLAITSDGALHAWGSNPYGQLGLGPDAVGTTVRETTLVSGVAAHLVTSGGRHNCIADAGGQVVCAGLNTYGQLGNDSSGQDTFEPIDGSVAFARLDAGYEVTCGLDAEAAVYCWGRNEPVILPDWLDVVRTPRRLGTASGYSDLSLGFDHTCLIREQRLECLGDNEHGELGSPAGMPHTTPSAVDGGARYARVSAGRDYTCALRANDDVVVCFGRNHAGQLGHEGEGHHEPRPVCVP